MAGSKSPRMSFKGWKFSEWVKGNSSTIKELVKVGVPYLLASACVDSATAQLISTIVGKLVLDSVEYYVKQY